MYTAYPRKEETAAAVPSSSFLTCMHHARGIPTLFSAFLSSAFGFLYQSFPSSFYLLVVSFAKVSPVLSWLKNRFFFSFKLLV
jgi:hypothetical protein